MQHIEEAGVHSGDSACSLPPYSLSDIIQAQLREQMRKLAFELNVNGLMNAQFAVKDDEIYLIEVNPRASRTIPFLSKMTDVGIVSIAVNIWEGKSLVEQQIVEKEGAVVTAKCKYGWAIKEAVFSFSRFTHLDPILGPQMRSTGEVVGIGNTFGEAYYKSQIASSNKLPISGKICVSVKVLSKSPASFVKSANVTAV